MLESIKPLGTQDSSAGDGDAKGEKIGAMNTMWANDEEVKINPPCWASALFFLDGFTYMESEFGVVDLVATGMFDLSHPATAQELDLARSLRAIRQKSSMAKLIVKWIAENKDLLDDYPEHLRKV